MRYFVSGFLLFCLALVALAGFRGSTSRQPPLEVFPDMDRQPKLRPQAPNSFFPDRLSSRLPVEGTVARGVPYEDSDVNTGRLAGTTNFVEVIPVPINAQLLARGRERFNISCAVCHGEVGDSNGITKKFGMAVVANLHDPRIVAMPDGELFSVITYGRNLMGAYGAQVSIEDRWAIIAYLRALHRSQLAAMDDVPEAQRAALKK